MIIGSAVSIFIGGVYSGLFDDIFHLFDYGSPFYNYGRIDTVYVVLLILAGIILSVFSGWLSGLLLYAFGELVDRTKSLDEKMQ